VTKSEAVNSLNDNRAANSQPLIRPGSRSGSVMVASTREGDAPKLAAASS